MRPNAVALGAITLVFGCAGAKPGPTEAPPPAVTASGAPLASSAPADRADTDPPRQKPGTRELVAELRQADGIADASARWAKKKALSQAIRELLDPRGADAIYARISRDPNWDKNGESAYFTTELCFALAEIGDLRALSFLARRLEHDPLTLYSESDERQSPLRRTDTERVTAARLIGDLALLYPAERAEIRKQTESAVLSWLDSMPSPHANAMRALARMGSDSDTVLKKLRAWADPPGALPLPAAQPPFPEEWATAQSALRYLGALRDKRSWTILDKQLKRRPARFDASMDALMNGGAILGMTLRALGYGAADGFSEWGDNKAFPLLLKYLESDKENEQSRIEACLALAWVAAPSDAAAIDKRLTLWSAPGKSNEFKLGCLLSGLAEHAAPETTASLLSVLAAKVPKSAKLGAASALARAPLDDASRARLGALLADADGAVPAALALLLGGTPDDARRAIQALPKAARGELEEAYFNAFNPVTDDDVTTGRVQHWVENANAISDFPARERLSQALSNLEYDAGPHSVTRVVLRVSLFRAAKAAGGDARRIRDALELMNERGVLLALDELASP